MNLFQAVLRARLWVLALAFAPVVLAWSGSAQAQSCPSNYSLPSAVKGDISVSCSLTLPKNSLVNARLIIEGEESSNLTLDCNGSRIQSGQAQSLLIRSRRVIKGPWSVPRNITIKNCTFIGGVRVYGLGLNGEAKAVLASSHSANHTQYAQANAPADIRFEHVVFQGAGAIPLYISPGTTHVTVAQSKFTGVSNSTAVYMDAESGHNQITNSRFHTQTARELIAIDGSANNRIDNNYFSSLSKGGIFVYRNCGEGGTVRHQKPEHNLIEGNTFYYKKYAGYTPALWFGARDGITGWRSYCSADKGYPFGSSADNGDFADNNIAQLNVFIARDPKWLIRDYGNGNQTSNNRQE